MEKVTEIHSHLRQIETQVAYMQTFQGYNWRLMQIAQSSPLFVILTVKNQETFWKMNSVKKHSIIFPIFFILYTF